MSCCSMAAKVSKNASMSETPFSELVVTPRAVRGVHGRK